MLAVIGGTGLDRMPGYVLHREEQRSTPFGPPSAAISIGERQGLPMAFLPRHGTDHLIPPHKINYRANIWALKEIGVERVVAVAAVGGLSANMPPGTIVIPDQIIDYTYGREHTFFDGAFQPVEHIEFGHPYCEVLRADLLDAAAKAGVTTVAQGCYGTTQGPRLETSAEIARMARDGSDLVGMTGMPEAALASEAGLCYATCAVVANWAAGLEETPILMEDIEKQLSISMKLVIEILMQLNMR